MQSGKNGEDGDPRKMQINVNGRDKKKYSRAV